MDKRWRRVAECLEERRVQLGWSKTRLYHEIDLSETTVRAMRDGHPLKRPEKYRRICEAVGWSSDSIERILTGSRPKVDSDPVTPAEPSDAVTRAEFEAVRSAVDELRLLLAKLVAAGIRLAGNGDAPTEQ